MPYTQAGKPETMKLPESNENRPTSCLQKWDHFMKTDLRVLPYFFYHFFQDGQVFKHNAHAGQSLHTHRGKVYTFSPEQSLQNLSLLSL